MRSTVAGTVRGFHPIPYYSKTMEPEFFANVSVLNYKTKYRLRRGYQSVTENYFLGALVEAG